MKKHPSIVQLLSEIDAFVLENAGTETSFGLDALKDGKFVSDLRKGRIPSLTTIDKVRAYMAPAPRRARATA